MLWVAQGEDPPAGKRGDFLAVVVVLDFPVPPRLASLRVNAGSGQQPLGDLLVLGGDGAIWIAHNKDAATGARFLSVGEREEAGPPVRVTASPSGIHFVEVEGR